MRENQLKEFNLHLKNTSPELFGRCRCVCFFSYTVLKCCTRNLAVITNLAYKIGCILIETVQTLLRKSSVVALTSHPSHGRTSRDVRPSLDQAVQFLTLANERANSF